MHRAIAQEADALREKRARMIKAQAELEVAEQLRKASEKVEHTMNVRDYLLGLGTKASAKGDGVLCRSIALAMKLVDLDAELSQGQKRYIGEHYVSGDSNSDYKIAAKLATAIGDALKRNI
jgi:hypothetical protein